MLQNFFSMVLSMSLTGSLLWITVRMGQPFTNRLCSAGWAKKSRIPVLLCYFIPIGLFLRPLLHPASVVTIPAALSPYGTAASLPPAWTMTAQGTKPDPASLSLFACLSSLWLAGALAVVFWLFFRQLRFAGTLSRTALPLEDGDAQQILIQLCKDLGLKPIPPLYSCPGVSTPFCAGLWHSAIYLPEVALPYPELCLILQHELAHLKGRDLLLKWASLAVLALHWFNPIAWALVRELGLLCETACDEAVTKNLDEEGRRLYGSAILNVLYNAAPLQGGVCSSLCSNLSTMKQRLRRILLPRPGRLGQLLCTGITAALLAALLPFSSAAHVWAQSSYSFGEVGDYQVSMTRTVLPYLPLGITYDARTDTIFYQGQALSIFMDTVPPTAEDLERFPSFTSIWKCNWRDLSNPDGPAYRALRDEQLQLIGVAPLTPQERDMFWNANENTVCYNSFYTTGDGDLYVSDPPWDNLPADVRSWASSLPEGTAASLQVGKEGYFCYSDMHCPWLLKPQGDRLKVYFYPSVGGDASRPCVLRYTTQSPAKSIEFYIDDIAAAP